MRNALAHANKNGRRVVSAFTATAFAQETPTAARKQWRHVADQLRANLPKLAALLDEAEADVLAFMDFPKERWTKIPSRPASIRLAGRPANHCASRDLAPIPRRGHARPRSESLAGPPPPPFIVLH